MYHLQYQTLYGAAPIIDKLSNPIQIIGPKMITGLDGQIVKVDVSLFFILNLIFLNKDNIFEASRYAKLLATLLLLVSLMMLTTPFVASVP